MLTRNKWVGSLPKSINYYTANGVKHVNGDDVDYASKAMPGDTVTMIIDDREYKKTVAFEKNGRDMGIAFGGLNDWDDIYIMFGVHYIGDRIKIIKYEVIEDKKS